MFSNGIIPPKNIQALGPTNTQKYQRMHNFKNSDDKASLYFISCKIQNGNIPKQ
jgi:hypothetical protein